MLKKARVKRIEGTHWALSLNLGINGTGSGVLCHQILYPSTMIFISAIIFTPGTLIPFGRKTPAKSRGTFDKTGKDIRKIWQIWNNMAIFLGYCQD